MWQEPKTDWTIDDYFNASDFNRIKNNLSYIRELAIALYEEFGIKHISDDKTYSDYFYADEINDIEDNLKTINENTLNKDFGEYPTYYENGNTMDFDELNRIESLTLELYDKISKQYNARRKLKFKFGDKEVF